MRFVAIISPITIQLRDFILSYGFLSYFNFQAPNEIYFHRDLLPHDYFWRGFILIM